MFGFCSLGSSSRGCAFVIGTPKNRILVDCGLESYPKYLDRCNERGIDPRVNHILVTHEHVDHLQTVHRVAVEHSADVWITSQALASRNALQLRRLVDEAQIDLRLYAPGDVIRLSDISLETIPVRHDVPNVGLVIRYEERHAEHADAKLYRVGYFTDLGIVTQNVIEAVNGLDALVIEANYELGKLYDDPANPRSHEIRERTASDLGHLSNSQMAELVSLLNSGSRGRNVKAILLAHLGEKSQDRELALSSARDGWMRGRDYRKTGVLPLIEAFPREAASRLYFFTRRNLRVEERGSSARRLSPPTNPLPGG